MLWITLPIAMFSGILLFGLTIGFDPASRRYLSISPETTVLITRIALVMMACGLVWFTVLLLITTRVLAVVYGFERNGRVFLGSWLGVLGVRWQAIECIDSVRVQFHSLDTRYLLTIHYKVTITSGGRKLRLHAYGASDPDGPRRVREWLESRGLRVEVVDLPTVVMGRS